MTRISRPGGASYLGSILSEALLSAGHHTTVLDNLSCGKQSLLHLCTHSRFEFVFGDARDERFVAALPTNAAVIAPPAALGGTPESYAAAEQFLGGIF